ncbi:MAG: CopG family transcriptional regulator [Dehalococcoidia bacterium]|nr:CopG family transcriptional regulator [Dehalococcoidia bacterium]MCB9491729.1 CopG family transcriptional regulator [Dehalococcoidia bacterium]
MVKRTTVSAEEDDLATLEREAKRRGVSLSLMLREAVMEYAAEIREANRPRFGYTSGPEDVAQESVDDEDAPYRHLKSQMDDHDSASATR